MSSTKSRFRIIGAFAALAALALAVGCRGFFPGTTYTSITIQESSSFQGVPLGEPAQFQLWGTDSTSGARGQITSGVDWSISTGTTGSATITSGGSATGTGLGAITIDASYQGLTTSDSTVVYLTNVTSICVSEEPTSGSCSASTETISESGGNTVSLYAIAAYTGTSGTAIQDITTSATWTISGPSTTTLTCATTSSPAVCTAVSSGGTTGTYTITVSYPGTSITGTNTVIVNP